MDVAVHPDDEEEEESEESAVEVPPRAARVEPRDERKCFVGLTALIVSYTTPFVVLYSGMGIGTRFHIMANRHNYASSSLFMGSLLATWLLVIFDGFSGGHHFFEHKGRVVLVVAALVGGLVGVVVGVDVYPYGPFCLYVLFLAPVIAVGPHYLFFSGDKKAKKTKKNGRRRNREEVPFFQFVPLLVRPLLFSGFLLGASWLIWTLERKNRWSQVRERYGERLRRNGFACRRTREENWMDDEDVDALEPYGTCTEVFLIWVLPWVAAWTLAVFAAVVKVMAADTSTEGQEQQRALAAEELVTIIDGRPKEVLHGQKKRPNRIALALLLLLIGAWVAASLAGAGHGIGAAIFASVVAAALGMAFAACYAFGFKGLMHRMSESEALRENYNTYYAPYADAWRGLGLVCVGPLVLVVYLPTVFLTQRIRSWKQRARACYACCCGGKKSTAGATTSSSSRRKKKKKTTKTKTKAPGPGGSSSAAFAAASGDDDKSKSRDREDRAVVSEEQKQQQDERSSENPLHSESSQEKESVVDVVVVQEKPPLGGRVVDDAAAAASDSEESEDSDEDDERLYWLTKGSRKQWEEMQKWNWTRVLFFATVAGLANVAVVVVVAKFTVLLMSYVVVACEELSVLAATMVIVGVGLFLFLLPPVPGAPIYLAAGVLLVAVTRSNGWPVIIGILYTASVSLGIKLAACTMQQKLIGEPLARSLWVRKTVGINSDIIRCTRIVLADKGFSMGKVALLVGGPDWPTSVLCGILKLPLLPVLLGTTPVWLLIWPTCLGGAFLIIDEPTSQVLSTIFVGLAALVQSGSIIVAAVQLRAEQSRRKEAIDALPIDEEVRAAGELDKAKSRLALEKTHWAKVPKKWRVALVLDVVLLTFACWVTTCYPSACFRDFAVNDRVSKRLQGNWTRIIKPLGLVALVATLAASALFVAFEFGWARRQVTQADVDELNVELTKTRDAGRQPPPPRDPDDDDDDDLGADDASHGGGVKARSSSS